MLVDGNIGETTDRTKGADLAGVQAETAAAERIGYDGLWTTETRHDPFLPLLLIAERSPRMQVGTAIAVAFARNPMTTAMVANDLQSLSGGRFILGLGSQIKAHIERRFSMPWSSPAARMREYVAAMRAIWQSWHEDTRLDFRGEFYQHTLMTPMFSPGPNPYGPPPVLIAAVGPQMTATAAQVADGMLVHGFTSERYLREVTLPQVEATLQEAGKDRSRFTMAYPGLVASAYDERTFGLAVAAVRERIAFYGSTPAYRGVLELHGWGELQSELLRLSKQQRWDTMAELIDDTILHTFAVVGEPAEVGKEIGRRFGGVVDRFTLYSPHPIDERSAQAIASQLQADRRTGPHA
jgi:probable F420-dependent oxidoreductase